MKKLTKRKRSKKNETTNIIAFIEFLLIKMKNQILINKTYFICITSRGHLALPGYKISLNIF